jgi:hypothetical protein
MRQGSHALQLYYMDEALNSLGLLDLKNLQNATIKCLASILTLHLINIEPIPNTILIFLGVQQSL